MTSRETDERFMRTALALGARGLGSVWPNPAVGCVIVKAGRIVGRGWTMPGGRPHAEQEALARAGSLAEGSTAYVTLEPCAHWGRTPPCVEALVEARIARCVVGLIDPDPRVDGRGIRRLREAGIAVEVGCLAGPARELAAGFITRVVRGRPLVALKLATSADGRVATGSGDSRWITGEHARAWVHGLRARYDAVMVGSGTVLADDPLLTARLPGVDRQPVRVVMDRRLRTPPDSRLARGASDVPTWVITRARDQRRVEALERAGVRVLRLAAVDARESLHEALALLAGAGITRVLVEGGAELGTALLRDRRVDRLYLFSAPVLIGGDGVSAVAALGVSRMAEAHLLRPVATRAVGPDRLTVFEPLEEPC